MQFHDKGIPQRLKHFYLEKKKKMSCFSSYTMNWPSLVRGHQPLTMINHEGQMYITVFKCLGYSPEFKGNISLLTFDGQLSEL